MRQHPWHFEWHTDWDRVWDPAFQRRWRRVLGRAAATHVFFEPATVRAWYDTHRGFEDIGARFLIATHPEGGHVFLPMAITRQGWKHGWLRVLAPVGANEFDYHDPIAERPLSPQGWVGFWEALEEEVHATMPDVDLLVAPRLHQGAVGVTRARDAGSGGEADAADGPRFDHTGLAPWINLAGLADLDGLLKRLPSQHRQDVRRQRRRLGEIGEVRLRVFGPDEEAAALDILPRFTEAHEARWPNAFRAAGFYENLIRHGLRDGSLHVSELLCGPRAIGWHLGFQHRDRFYYYLPAFDLSMRKHSPGKVHLALLLEQAIERGLHVFDMLVGAESYKRRWASGQAQLFGFRSVTPSVSASAKDYFSRRVRPSLAAARRKLKRSV
ncbi:MAG: GNAT family N-acetyltransferase [Planctomycetota bacterium]|jgi:CelD/BcsL family acetyltransferase involved in cellulose biosynthesis